MSEWAALIIPVIVVISTTVSDMQDKKMKHEIEMKKIECHKEDIDLPEEASQ